MERCRTKPALAMAPQAPVRLCWDRPGQFLCCGIALCFQIQLDIRSWKQNSPCVWLPSKRCEVLLASDTRPPALPPPLPRTQQPLRPRQPRRRAQVEAGWCWLSPSNASPPAPGFSASPWGPWSGSGGQESSVTATGLDRDCRPHAKRSVRLPCQVPHGVVVGPPHLWRKVELRDLAPHGTSQAAPVAQCCWVSTASPGTWLAAPKASGSVRPALTPTLLGNTQRQLADGPDVLQTPHSLTQK